MAAVTGHLAGWQLVCAYAALIGVPMLLIALPIVRHWRQH